MTIFSDSKAFVERTGIVSDYQQIVALGIIPDCILGSFYRSSVDDLRSFCNANPEFHIVSLLTANTKVNRFSPGGILFFLANGDPDKQLIYDISSLIPKLGAA